ncbi:histidine kinase [Paraflavitalea sp. CAU 1676]|uniref:sensor histidine kinase n=1 Tax=Paraflavitalea sp. CAU 1676 TaxID=3032598 RepID=UPI0023DB7C73|nr:histidine kinase [Paraflavitalea sp. CAU 1676]MDF2190397.1 histidine kinase [Paraflavitalea sp. CAU 1676]
MKIKEAMSKTKKNTLYLLVLAAAAIPLAVIASFYVDALNVREEGLIVFFITVYFIVGVYIGRYVSQIWTKRFSRIPTKIFITLGVVMLASLLSMFMFGALSVNTRFFLPFFLLAASSLILSIATGIMIKLVRYTVSGQLQDARADAAQSHSELKLLQSQLSPHFLFNTLNNIYGISLTRHEKVPPLLLKLSDLLRYSVYDAREQFVPLQSEMEYIHNYIDFEKIRIGEKLVLTTEFEYHIDPKIKIAPLLLIIFIENAFKHAKNTTQQEIYIDIKLKIWGNSILFAIKNSNKTDKGERGILNVHSGFGLDNVRKRLELLYENQYQLDIEDEDDSYKVSLQLRIKK